jgi:hypothetical protein
VIVPAPAQPSDGGAQEPSTELGRSP